MTDIQSGYFRCKDGVELSYSQSGDGFPVILANGLGNLKEGWNESIQSFERYFRVIRYDYRNQGQRIDRHGNLYSTKQHAEDLLALLEHLAIEKFVGIGISTGARILSDFADISPSRLQGLILMGVALNNISHRNLIIFKSWLNAINASSDEDWSPYVETYIPWIYGPDYLSAVEPPVKRIAAALAATMTRQGTASNIQATMASLRAGLDDPVQEQTITVPALILQGEYDLMAPPGTLNALERRFENHTLHIIPGAGHNVRGENRQEFERLALDFLLDELDL